MMNELNVKLKSGDGGGTAKRVDGFAVPTIDATTVGRRPHHEEQENDFSSGVIDKIEEMLEQGKYRPGGRRSALRGKGAPLILRVSVL